MYIYLYIYIIYIDIDIIFPSNVLFFSKKIFPSELTRSDGHPSERG